jgi:hypothetical protein
MGKIESDPYLVKIHDYFNLISLSIIVTLIVNYLTQATDLTKLGTPNLGQEHLDLFFFFFIIFVSYLIIDTIWIYLYPKCVVTDHRGLLLHHLLCIPLCAVPYLEPQFSWHMIFALSTEFNTFLIVLRRQLEVGTFIHRLCDTLFYITWVVLKLILFPWLSYFYSREYVRISTDYGTFHNFTIIAPILQYSITLLTFKWTYDMLAKIFKKKRKD